MSNSRPWTPAQDALLGTDIDRKVAKQLRRSTRAICYRRRVLNVVAFARPGGVARIKWGPTELGLLGRYPDDDVVRITGRSLKQVQAKRAELKSSNR